MRLSCSVAARRGLARSHKPTAPGLACHVNPERHASSTWAQRATSAVKSALGWSTPEASPTMPGIGTKRSAASWDDATRIQLIREAAILPSKTQSLERSVFEKIDPNARFVLIGEASHGTEEFYRTRAELTKMLIRERGFNAVVCESDFPDAFRVNLYVRGMQTKDRTPEEALSEYKRFPTWMWRNNAIVDFVSDLKQHNESLPPEERDRLGAGFYGMDLYSLHSSAAKVLEFLQQVDPAAGTRARERYKCFDRYGADSMAYAYAVGVGGAPSCAAAAVSTLLEVFKKAPSYVERLDGAVGQELALQAKANAMVVKNAENYYRQMFFGDELTWNLRDSHFLEAVKLIEEHLAQRVERPKLVLWAHNSHLGDARATDMGWKRGELNIGQLMRQHYGPQAVFNIGFTTHTGTVSAADEWDSPVQCKTVRKSMPGSYEYLFHRAEMVEFALDFRHKITPDLNEALEGPLLERAIGVIYRPHTERASHYFNARLPQQFDMVIHLDNTAALRPLEITGPWAWDEEAREDAPETFPSGV